jgi:carboxylesterase
MIRPAAALLGALAFAARAMYPILVERRAVRRRALGAGGIVEGAATIARGRRGDPAVLLLHGGGDTPQVVAGLGEYLLARGFAVRAPLLPGHGRSLSALRRVSAAELRAFVHDEYDALRRHNESVSVVGLSMGGALAIELAARHRDLPALVLLAPYVDMPAAIRRLATTSALWGWVLPYFSSRGEHSIRDPGAAAEALGHGVLTPAMLRALHDIVRSADEALPRVSAPTLVVQSREDNRISTDSAERAFERLGSKQKRFVWTEGAAHVITVDYGRERVFELCADWLEKHRRNEGAARPGEGAASSVSP